MMKVGTWSGKRKREPEGPGIYPDKDAAGLSLISMPRVYSRETGIADLPDELLYQVAGRLVPSSPYLASQYDSVARIFPYASGMHVIDQLSRTGKWALALVQAIRIHPAFHDFRQLASQVEYAYRNCSGKSRESSIQRYRMDPVIAPQTRCPQRAACHLDFPPSALQELAVQTIEACWHRGLGHAVVAREVRSASQLARLVQLLQYGRSEVEEVDITLHGEGLDLSALLRALQECTGIQHLALSIKGAFPSEQLCAFIPISLYTSHASSNRRA